MTRSATLGVACAILLFGITVPLFGQEVGAVRSGDRVRVTLASRIAPAPLIGTVIAIDPDTLIVEREEGGMRRVTPRQVARIEVSVERRSEAGKAAGYGILTTAPILVPGFILMLTTPYGWYVFGIGALFAVGTAAAGAGFGGGPQDVWVEATWPPATARLDAAADQAPRDSVQTAEPDTTER